MTANASTAQIDAEMNATARTAAAYLQHRLYPQAAALGVVLEAVAPGRYRVQPQDSYDGAGNRHYAIIEDADGGELRRRLARELGGRRRPVADVRDLAAEVDPCGDHRWPAFLAASAASTFTIALSTHALTFALCAETSARAASPSVSAARTRCESADRIAGRSVARGPSSLSIHAHSSSTVIGRAAVTPASPRAR